VQEVACSSQVTPTSKMKGPRVWDPFIFAFGTAFTMAFPQLQSDTSKTLQIRHLNKNMPK
jgi:hypothetical protein